jgi:hypothetical protein
MFILKEMSDNGPITELDQIKYNLVLELVNKILVNMNKSIINNLEEFKDIVRQDVITEANYKAVEEMEENILKYFDKAKSGYYQKKRSGINYSVNFLRGLLRQINYELENMKKDMSVNINGINYRKTFMIYSIKKK